ncbi:MAG: hypothetical protein ABIJ47_01705 [Candidatus Bathyarchaeota archaeon]
MPDQPEPRPYEPHIPDAFKVDMAKLRRERNPVFDPIIRSHVDWGLFYEGGYHSLLHGKTGAGKTTLQLYLLWILHEAGHRIVHRDDGNREFLYLAPYVPMVVWHPEGTVFELKAPHRYPNVEIRTFTEPGEILDAVYKTPQRFHAILYDCYCFKPGPQARFYSEFFKTLIFRCMQAEYEDWDEEDETEGDETREPLVASFDEINDLIPPRGKSLSKDHADVLGQIVQSIRKLRKYRVTLIASVHRFNQLDLDVRSQFSYYWIKKSYGQDIYHFMNTNLWTVTAQSYQAAMRFVTAMPRDQVLLFDGDGNYDKMRWPDIPRVKPRNRVKGEIKAEEDEGGRFDEIDLIIAVARSKQPPESFRSIADRLGRAPSSIRGRAAKLRRLPHLQEAMQ